MATPPNFVAEYETSWAGNPASLSVTPTTTVGDILAVLGGVSDTEGGINTPTGNSLTYSLQQSITTAGNIAAAYVWTAPDNTGGAGWTLQATQSGTGVPLWGFNALRFSGHGGVGASAKTNVASGAPSLNITTQQDNSALVVINADWNAADGTTRTWRTVNGTTPTAGNGFELTYFRDSLQWTVYVAYYPDVGTAGVKTVGLSAPGAQAYSIIAVEIKGTSGGGILPYIGGQTRRRQRHLRRQQLLTAPGVIVAAAANPPEPIISQYTGFY